MDLREEVAAFGITEGDLSKGTPRKLVEKRGPKVYRVEVSGGGDLDVSPQVAIFEVSEESAREIIRLAELVKANDLHKVERFDYRTEFLQFDPENSPEDAEEQGDENSVRTECDSLSSTRSLLITN